ncbi:MAG: succinylglutamate desuccinylase/aspartoacylase family protein [Patescibacteria group bacterium]
MSTAGEDREPEVRGRVLEALRTFGEKTLRYSGERRGPSILIVGGTHGNEVLGVLVADMMRQSLENGDLKLVSGEVQLTLGNTRAIEADQRTASGGIDLNRIFTPSVLSGREDKGWEGSRAQKITEAIRSSDIVIDLHSTNRPSPAFVCALGDEEHSSVYKWLPRESVVLDPERIVSGGGGSIDEVADDFGKVGICYESGQATDMRNTIPVFEAIRAILIERGMVEGVLPELPPSGSEYRVVTSVPYDANRPFIFAEGKDQGFAPIAKGEIIGYQGNIPVHSSVNGIILFPKKPEHQESAGLVCYLASRKETQA